MPVRTGEPRRVVVVVLVVVVVVVVIVSMEATEPASQARRHTWVGSRLVDREVAGEVGRGVVGTAREKDAARENLTRDERRYACTRGSATHLSASGADVERTRAFGTPVCHSCGAEEQDGADDGRVAIRACLVDWCQALPRSQPTAKRMLPGHAFAHTRALRAVASAPAISST